MIGKVYKSLLPYYDKYTHTQKFKSRPCLLIGRADRGDYVILPISSVSDPSKIDPFYDIPLDKSRFTFLHKNSFLRTHKQTICNAAFLKDQLADFRLTYEDTYIEALSKVEAFQKQIINAALYVNFLVSEISQRH